jgi:hypothetical protein
MSFRQDIPLLLLYLGNIFKFCQSVPEPFYKIRFADARLD